MNGNHYRASLQKLLNLTSFETLSTVHTSQPRSDLSRISAFLNALGNPQHCAPVIHIAGSKGKGSTASMCASVLTAHGYKVGLYTSPHLHTFRERVKVGDEPIPEEEFAALCEEVWPLVEQSQNGTLQGAITVFEALTAIAFLYFERQRVNFQVIEVGLGGRLDATNVVNPSVSVITSLSLEHTSILGNTLAQIAKEKAGIIKPSGTVVCAPQRPEAIAVIREVCDSSNARLVEVERSYSLKQMAASLDGQRFHMKGRLREYDLWLPLLGDHQLENAATAVGVMEVLQEMGFSINPDAIVQGFKNVDWPCRMEVLQCDPLVIADGAHNPDSCARLREAVKSAIPFQQLILVMGVSVGKNLPGMVSELAPLKPVVVATRAKHPKSIPTSRIAELFAAQGIPCIERQDVNSALASAIGKTRPGDAVLVTGSLFVAAEARHILKGVQAEEYPELEPYHSAH
jgi:dihydrofolate synthase/folylpolyglutamate synthase